ncbi:TPA: tetraacyldisaccharide 4'-kinase [Candidatus Dependentiae bacterium]|nr:MAG: Tetraacyldisaccharide 4'-kinase [candidate division TM6 bacterium GW2011_GWE2_31_21]KKP53241.1 MAG: Tetraacyldisaccharide 4'-kinase [candidate division TM6 bacterium GW2011_GWF2_33_332]HBS48060.1 tetraacyldisaccharide 4'-kinase [Candidatus Dependentiae bacterium]HBZ73337.1 tetraacyldisaccharide 4'-kinase [Candidatus Dependentiae bacterium]
MISLNALWRNLSNKLFSIKNKIINLWDKDEKSLSFFNKIILYFLFIFEFFYKIFFQGFIFWNKNFGKPLKTNFKVISIGNISCGGTGKSVLARYLIENIKAKGAILLRGYKSQNEKTGKSFLVSDGNNIFCKSDFCGDEAFMLASSLKIPVVIGKNRSKSVDLLNNLGCNYLVLDDAYQNFALKKDYEILLLDARNPFGNNHCLPAGPLREKDINRADIIIFTHADEIDDKKRLELKRGIKKQNIFFGKHALSFFMNSEMKRFLIDDFESKRFVAFAGIGSFSGFCRSLEKTKINLVKSIEFEDHHQYSIQEVIKILEISDSLDAFGVITTLKDWVKICNFFSELDPKLLKKIYFLDISFDFLNKEEEILFFNLIKI